MGRTVEKELITISRIITNHHHHHHPPPYYYHHHNHCSIHDSHEVDEEGVCPYGKPWLDLIEACRQGDEATVLHLLDTHHVPPYAQDLDGDGVSALMAAASVGKIGLVQLLLSRGAPWNALDKKGKCAGEYAIENHHQETIDALVSHAVMAELLLGASSTTTVSEEEEEEGVGEHKGPRSEAYLSGAVRYEEEGGEERLVDEGEEAVMMQWEAPLMQAHAQVCTNTTTTTTSTTTIASARPHPVLSAPPSFSSLSSS